MWTFAKLCAPGSNNTDRLKSHETYCVQFPETEKQGHTDTLTSLVCQDAIANVTIFTSPPKLEVIFHLFLLGVHDVSSLQTLISEFMLTATSPSPPLALS
jgi:hypothetical protein